MMFETLLYICRNYKDFNNQFPLIKECSLSLDLIKSLSMSFIIAMSDHLKIIDFTYRIQLIKLILSHLHFQKYQYFNSY
jgi:hypothetical protein